MTILNALPLAPLWDWVFRNLGGLGFVFDPDLSAWRGNHQGRVFYVFAAEPFVAHFQGRTEDLCEVLARMDRTTPEKIKKRIAAAYRKVGGEVPQHASFTDSGHKYSRLAAMVRERYGVRD